VNSLRDILQWSNQAYFFSYDCTKAVVTCVLISVFDVLQNVWRKGASQLGWGRGTSRRGFVFTPLACVTLCTPRSWKGDKFAWKTNNVCLKHLWAYVITRVGNLTEGKSLCVQLVSGTMISAAILCCEQNLATFYRWRHEIRHCQMMTQIKRYFRHAILAPMFQFVTWVGYVWRIITGSGLDDLIYLCYYDYIKLLSLITPNNWWLPKARFLPGLRASSTVAG
jgi:hypothetical protein